VICAVLYLQPRCHPYTVYKLNSFLHKLHIITTFVRMWLQFSMAANMETDWTKMKFGK